MSHSWKVWYDPQLMHGGRWVVFRDGERYWAFATQAEADDFVDEQRHPDDDVEWYDGDEDDDDEDEDEDDGDEGYEDD